MNIEFQRQRLEELSIHQLRREYEEVFGEACASRHKHYLIKRILWRIQANTFGSLSSKALRQARKLANNADLRMTEPQSKSNPNHPTKFLHLPKSIASKQLELAPGMQLERIYRGQKIVVTIMDNGIRWNGQLYSSLSAVAKAVTGSHWNGRAFFKISGRRRNG